MRKDLLLAFLGFWVMIVPFLPIAPGSTQTAMLVVLGVVIIAFALLSMKRQDSSDE